MKTVVLGFALATLAACGPSDIGASRLKSHKPGANRSVVVSAMGAGPLASAVATDAPRLVNGFRRQAFMTSGRQIEVLWYREAPGSLNDALEKKLETPVVFEADTLVGWGWKFYNQFSKDNNLPNPERDKEWQDSVSKATLTES